MTGFKTGAMKQEYVNAIESLLNGQENHSPPHRSVLFAFTSSTENNLQPNCMPFAIPFDIPHNLTF